MYFQTASTDVPRFDLLERNPEIHIVRIYGFRFIKLQIPGRYIGIKLPIKKDDLEILPALLGDSSSRNLSTSRIRIRGRFYQQLSSETGEERKLNLTW